MNKDPFLVSNSSSFFLNAKFLNMFTAQTLWTRQEQFDTRHEFVSGFSKKIYC